MSDPIEDGSASADLATSDEASDSTPESSEDASDPDLNTLEGVVAVAQSVKEDPKAAAGVIALAAASQAASKGSFVLLRASVCFFNDPFQRSPTSKIVRTALVPSPLFRLAVSSSSRASLLAERLPRCSTCRLILRDALALACRCHEPLLVFVWLEEDFCR